MDNAAQYRKELDFIFQEIEDKKKLQRQATTKEMIDFIVRLTERKRVQRLFEVLSPEERRAFVQAAVRKQFPNQHDSG